MAHGHLVYLTSVCKKNVPLRKLYEKKSDSIQTIILIKKYKRKSVNCPSFIINKLK